jgi:hypothetical protein
MNLNPTICEQHYNTHYGFVACSAILQANKMLFAEKSRDNSDRDLRRLAIWVRIAGGRIQHPGAIIAGRDDHDDSFEPRDFARRVERAGVIGLWQAGIARQLDDRPTTGSNWCIEAHPTHAAGRGQLHGVFSRHLCHKGVADGQILRDCTTHACR